MKRITIFSALVFLLSQCRTSETTELQLGAWRGEFIVFGQRVPFNVSVEDDTTGTIKVFLVNASERFQLDSVRYERDSVLIPVDVYDAVLIAKVKGDSLFGYLRKNQSGKQGVAFRAARNQRFRFVPPEVTTHAPFNVSEKWSVLLTSASGELRYTGGKFAQHDGSVEGTILTTTGDYRFLDGSIIDDSLKLSGFNGSNPSLLRARFLDSTHLSGEFISPGGKVAVAAVKSDTAKLPDPYSLTYLKDSYDKLSFRFPDLYGNQVSLEDEKYKGKVVVVTIMGSWCPNCVDEAAFLAPWYKLNKDRGVEIVGLSFERKDDFDFARSRLDKFIKRFDVRYDILFAGLADKVKAAEKLPALNAVLSFPTTIVVDRQGKVRSIHTGFSGPATGEDYHRFIEEFNREIDAALGE